MISSLLALLSAQLLPILGGTAAGFLINGIRSFAGPGAKTLIRLVPVAIRLALKLRNGEDAEQDAAELLKRTPDKLIRKQANAAGLVVPDDVLTD